MKRAILIIGIDGGTWTVLKPAMDDGYMPELKKLAESGACGILESTMPAITPAAWGSFLTGVNPGANGVFHFAYLDKQQKKVQYVSSKTLQKPIYEIAGKAGKRVGFINVPMTYPPCAVNGCLVTGILTPSLESEFTYPPKLKKQILEAIPDYHIFNMKNLKEESPHANPELFCQRMATIIKNRVRAAKLVLKNDAFDLFMVHFQSTDLVQHALWSYLDTSHPEFDPTKRHVVLDTIYRLLDQQIQQLRQEFISKAGAECLTLIVSDHGFETHKKRINLGNWLCQHNYLTLHTQQSKLKKITKKLEVGRFLKRFLPERAVDGLANFTGITQSKIDWGKSEAFAIGRSSEGFIYLLADNSEKRKKITADIIDKLQTIQDPKTNTPVVHAIHRKEDIYHGDYMEHMPDLIVEPVSGYTFTSSSQPNEDLFQEVCSKTDLHVGKHHRDGVIIAAGHDIQSIHSLQAQITDMVPTLLYYLQIPLGEYLKGRIVQELFKPAFIRQNPLPARTKTASMPHGMYRPVYSNTEEKEIEQRLKDMGYM